MVERKRSLTPTLFLLSAIAMLIIAIYSLYEAYLLFQEPTGMNQFNLYFIIGLASLALSLSMITRFIRRMASSKKPKPKVMTTIECRKCGLKEIRKFMSGDYVMKTVENCPKCNEPKIITSIYIEGIEDQS